MERVESINGKTSKTKQWHRLNKRQVLETTKKGSRIIYPYKINDEKIPSNLFRFDGNLIVTIILVSALLLVIYNNEINRQECEEVMSDPCKFCGDTLSKRNLTWGFSDAFRKEDTRYST